MTNFYKGSDLVCRFTLNTGTISELKKFKVAFYTTSGNNLVFDMDTPYNPTTGGVKVYDEYVLVYVPTDVLNTLNDGVVKFELRIGVANDYLPDGSHDIIFASELGINLKQINTVV